MKREEGNVIWLDPADSVGLCAQVPWIFNATLRKNIIMDAPFDDLRFDNMSDISCMCLHSTLKDNNTVSLSWNEFYLKGRFNLHSLWVLHVLPRS